ncbi:MAG: hypothetical protein ACLRSW_06460 [Christensenellaceae bacterium]
MQGKEILDAAASTGYGQEQKIFEQSQTGALENFELNIDVALNKWDGSKGEATTMGTTFTGVVIVDFGNNKHLRVNLYKANDTWAALQVQLREGNGNAQNQQLAEIASANGIAELVSLLFDQICPGGRQRFRFLRHADGHGFRLRFDKFLG